MAVYSSTIINNGYVEKLFLNKSYSKKAVVSILDLLELKAGEMYILLYTRDLAIQVTVSCYGEGQYTIDDNTNSVKLFSTLTDDTLDGWADFELYEINDVALSMYDEVEVGNQNYKLVQVIGMSEFTGELLELEPYLYNLGNSIKRKKSIEGELNAQAFSNEIDSIELGVDTRDANARPSDLRAGAIAYSKNSKVVGNIPNYFGEFEGEAIKSELSIPTISNYTLSETGELTWDALDVSSLEEYNPSVSYIVALNGVSIKTTETTLQIYSYLKNGENYISITGVIALESSKGETVEYEKTMEFKATTYIVPDGRKYYGVAGYGNNLYVIGGRLDGDLLDDVLVLDLNTGVWSTWQYKLPVPLSNIEAVANQDGIWVPISQYKDDSGTFRKYDVFMIKFSDGKLRYERGLVFSGTTGQAFADENYTYAVETRSSSSRCYSFRIEAGIVASIVRILTRYGEKGAMNVSCVAKNKTAYIVGGNIPTEYVDSLKDITIIDYKTLNVEVLENVLSMPITKAITMLVDDDIYILGGCNNAAPETGILDVTIYNTVQKFNISSRTCELLDYTLSIPVRFNAIARYCVLGRSCYMFNQDESGLIYVFTV